MPYVFPVYPLGKDTPGAPVVPGAVQLYPYTPGPELGYAHWLFGGSDASLAPYGGSSTLSAQGTLHTWGSGYVNLPSYANALVSNVPDAREQTFYAAVRYLPVAGKNVILAGNISLASQGAGLWIDPSGNVCTVLRNPSSTVLVNHGPPAGAVPGDMIFVGLSKRVEGGVSKTRTLVGNTLYETAWPGLQDVSGSNRISAGNAYASTAVYTPADLRVAELLILPAAADAAAKMLTVYSHSRARLALRGILLK
ncbi:hypothetical protein NJG16_05585 [Stenotrophomonas maltophilia]|nr:hypothetical protein [Stenotrophomonas maltophilia]